MRDHPIPQDIISYRFHIVGNMTLKQFLEVAGGVVLAVIMYKTGLPGIIKWPFILLFAATGAAAAFLPIAERPLDHWITTYFKIMFKPTKYFWKKTALIPALFNYKQSEDVGPQTPFVNTAPLKKQQASDFMASLSPAKTNEVETQEEQKISQVLNYFQPQAPNTKVASTPAAQITQTIPRTTPEFKAPVVKEKVARSTTANSSIQLVSAPVITFDSDKKEQETKTQPVGPKQNVVYEAQVPTELELPPESASQQFPESYQDLNAGIFNSNLPFPSAPTQPNTLVGMVLNQAGEMIPGAIIEIKNQGGQVERAVKSNALGQFFVTTPLKPAVYTVGVEADGFSFEPFTFETNNAILSPLEIRSLN